MLGHRVEIPIVVKKGMAFFDAERANDDIYSLAHCNSLCPQEAVVTRSLGGKRIVQHRSNGELAKILFDQSRVSLATGALKDFEKNQVADQNIWRSHRDHALQVMDGFGLRFTQK